jgi:hypothetical protein
VSKKHAIRANNDKSHTPQTIKEVLAHDYKIPGISQRYYVPVTVVVFIALSAFGSAVSSDINFFIGVTTLLAISIVSSAIQRFVRRIRRRTRSQ